MWQLLKHRIIAYRSNVSDDIAQDAYDTVLEDMEKLESFFRDQPLIAVPQAAAETPLNVIQ